MKPTVGVNANTTSRLVTGMERLSIEGFARKYCKASKTSVVIGGSRSPRAIAASLIDGLDANLSFTESSASKVANLRNYYNRPEWAGKEYHMIFTKDEVLVIKRDKDFLDGDDIGCSICAHNENGDVVLYTVCK